MSRLTHRSQHRPLSDRGHSATPCVTRGPEESTAVLWDVTGSPGFWTPLEHSARATQGDAWSSNSVWE